MTSSPGGRLLVETLLIMKLSVMLILATTLQVVAKDVRSQSLTLDVKNASLRTVLNSITKQSGFHFVYMDSQLSDAAPVTIRVENGGLEAVLAECFKNQPLEYSIKPELKQVVIRVKQEENIPNTRNPGVDEIEGKIFNEMGEPLQGATVMIKGTNKGVQTGPDGSFTLRDIAPGAILHISYIGYISSDFKLKGDKTVSIQLRHGMSELDQTVIMAYGTTTRRLSTSDITTVSGKEIETQPVDNVLGALEGRVPGLLINQGSGVPGAAYQVQLRGQSSIGIQPGTLPANNPLFIIDGVPYAPNNSQVSLVALTALGNHGLSPLIGINASDIESIEVLKDADATAIYGSRGANGVILITTKHAKAAGLRFTGNVYSGVSESAPMANLMNTKQYLAMRREALANDGQPINSNTAPDLTLWDTTKNTDFKKQFIGNTSHITNAEASLSGGTVQTQYLIGGSFHHETTVFPTDLGDNRVSGHFNLQYTSPDHRFKVSMNDLYVYDKNRLPGLDLANYINLNPMLTLKDSTGKLLWDQNGVPFTNPLAAMNQSYTGETYNLLANLVLSYTLFDHLTLRANLGYNTTEFKEVALSPLTALPPGYQSGTYYGGDNFFKSWIIEPQAEYQNNFGKSRVDVLVGGTFLENINNASTITATGFTSDALLSSVENASSLQGSSDNTEYHYASAFGRVNYSWAEKYIVTLSARRDGSSRFGPGRQFGNFGSAGAAWIFSNENWFREHVGFLSFGKLRGSYGTTGNDQIGDYLYYDSWQTPLYVRPYGSSSGLTPSRLFNPNFQWEVNKKLEAAIDLGFAKDRVVLSADWYRNRSSNLLIAYELPSQTGFLNIPAQNFPAVVQNTGFELTLLTKNITGGKFSWSTRITLTVPRNKLVSFPGLATSAYNSVLAIGQSLHVVRGYKYLGVDPTTGVFQFSGASGKTSSPATTDMGIIGNTDAKWFGGILNTITYGDFQLDFFFEGNDQNSLSYLQQVYQNAPPGSLNYGMNNNQPVAVLARWQTPGQNASLQQFTATPGTNAYSAVQPFLTSSATIVNGSFIRLKTASLSYSLPKTILKKAHVSATRIYVSGLNLLTFSAFKGADPETQSFMVTPPLRTVTGGIQLNF